jgi:hypothetical protein
MVPRHIKALGLRYMVMVQGRSLVPPLENTPQHSRQKCMPLDRGYRNRKICVLSNRKAAIKSLTNYQINSKLAWDCHYYLMRLDKHNRVQLT